MTKGFLYGMLALVTIWLILIVIYIGALVMAVQPGERVETITDGAVYLELPQGRIAPVSVVTSAEVMTYTFVVRRKP